MAPPLGWWCFLVILAVELCSGAALAKEVSPGADYVFRHGGVYTLDSQNPWAQAVAVQGDTIVFVGSDEDSRAFVGPGTQVVDLAGLTLRPGFVDGHNHLLAPFADQTSKALLSRLPQAGITACQVLGFSPLRELECFLEREAPLPFRMGGVYAPEDFLLIPQEVSLPPNPSQHPPGLRGQIVGVELDPHGGPPGSAKTEGEGRLAVAQLVFQLTHLSEGERAVHFAARGPSALPRFLLALETVRRRQGRLPGRVVLHSTPHLTFEDRRRLRDLKAGVCLVAEHGADLRAPWPPEDNLLEGWEGLSVAFGTDLPFTDLAQAAPLRRMQRALEAAFPLPEARRREALARMLRGHTLEGACQMGLENAMGSIEVGKHADLVVLGGLLFDTPSRHLGDLPVLLTLVDGGETHRDPRLPAAPIPWQNAAPGRASPPSPPVR